MSHNIIEQLLQLEKEDLKIREKAKQDFFYFLGKCQNRELAVLDLDTLGQSWITADNLDYVPTEDIRNKVKPLLKKQARFMFGVEPYLLFKPYDSTDKDKVEALRQFISGILEDAHFWSDTLKAFLMCTIKSRVLMMLEANPGQPIRIFYYDIDDFKYESSTNNARNIDSITLVSIDASTAGFPPDKQVWYRYTYYIEGERCLLKTDTFNGIDIFDPSSPSETKISDTKLSDLPGTVIINGGFLGNSFGESDLDELKSPQDQYNRKVSDFADALRFQMFGQTAFVDVTEESVNQAKIAPNSVLPLVSIEGKKGDIKRVESAFSNAEPIELFLKRAEHDMHQALSMPEDDQLKNIPSAKAMKYMYTDLIARCEEKWKDWEPAFKDLVRMIIESCSKFECYTDWDHDWDNLKFNIVLKHNYPIPDDEGEKKDTAISEVKANVRSIKSYIRDLSDDEDVEAAYNEIIQEISDVQSAVQDQLTTGAATDINAGGGV